MKPLLDHLDAIDGPTPEEIARIRRRLAAQRPRPLAIAAPIALSLAAAAALLLGVLPSASPPAAAPEPLEGALDAGLLTLTPNVRLDIDGIGSVSGHAEEIDIVWQLGTLNVDVTPAQGIALTVRTENADVSVVGTVFAVEQTVLGTTISVTEGVVSIECADMTHHRLTSGETTTCLPQKAHTGRLETLMDMGAPPEQVLAETRRVLAMKPEKAIQGELLSAQIEVLLQSGNRAAAAAVAWRYLEEGHTARAADFSSLAQEAYP